MSRTPPSPHSVVSFFRFHADTSVIGSFSVPRADSFRPNSWWVSRQNQKMDYWGGALPGSRKCECGLTGECVDNTKWCNCDSNLDGWQEDGGDITEMEYLPVMQLRFGDTGTPVDEKEGRYLLGPLICEGDGKFTGALFISALERRPVCLILLTQRQYRFARCRFVQERSDLPHNGRHHQPTDVRYRPQRRHLLRVQNHHPGRRDLPQQRTDRLHQGFHNQREQHAVPVRGRRRAAHGDRADVLQLGRRRMALGVGGEKSQGGPSRRRRGAEELGERTSGSRASDPPHLESRVGRHDRLQGRLRRLHQIPASQRSAAGSEELRPARIVRRHGGLRRQMRE